MIVNNIDFFNIAEVGKDGTLSRFPQRALSAIGMPEYDEAGRVIGIYTGHEHYARKLTNCELRFATASDEIAVCLYAENPVEVSVYQGDYRYAAAEHLPHKFCIMDATGTLYTFRSIGMLLSLLTLSSRQFQIQSQIPKQRDPLTLHRGASLLAS